jgi:hypothetical protein
MTKDMKHLLRNGLMTVVGLALMGCEWGGGGGGSDDNSWNDRYNFVNFSGSYRGANGGGYIVTEFTTASSGGGGGTISGEEVGTGNGTSTSFSGGLSHFPVIPGSVVISLPGYNFTDNGSGVLVGSIPGTAGSIAYPSGGWSIDLGSGILNSGVKIVATYSYTNTASSGSSTPPGSSSPLYSFNVQQEGNKLRLIDNNGCLYEGNFGSIRTTGGTDQDTTNPTYNNGDQIIGQFDASGISAANIKVQMTGNFQAVITGSQTTSAGTTMTLAGRQILGTWIEEGGMTGDINGTAVDVSVTAAASPSATP